MRNKIKRPEPAATDPSRSETNKTLLTIIPQENSKQLTIPLFGSVSSKLRRIADSKNFPPEFLGGLIINNWVVQHWDIKKNIPNWEVDK